MTVFDVHRWEQKRSTTIKAFVLECAALGMEYSVTFLTLWLYVTTLVVTDKPKVFYSIISASYLLSAVLFSILIGRWVDKTRNVRITFLVCNLSVIVGNILYSLHQSPWFLVVGRFLCGIGGPLRSVMSGEVCRCFPTDQMTRKFSLMGTAFSLGFILGPGVNFVFKDLDVTFGPFHLTVTNAAGFYMAALFAMVQFVVFLAVTDLSKEYDLKAVTLSLADVPYPTTNPYLDLAKPIDVSYPPGYTCQESAKSFSFNQQQKQMLTDEAFLKNPSCDPIMQNSVTTTCHLEASINTISLNGSINDLSISSLPLPYCGGRSRSSFAGGSRITTAQSIALHKSVAVEKMENSTLFPQTFTRADAMLSVSVMLVGDHLAGELVGLLDANTPIPSTWEVLKQIGSSIDAVVVFVLSFFMYFWMVAFDMWLPMMIIDVLGMEVTELNAIVFGFGCISAVILLLLSWKQFDDRSMFKLSLACVLCLGLMEVIFGSMKMFKQPLYVNVALWVVWGTLFAIVVVMDEVFLIGILAKMTSSRIQTFNESLRLAMTRSGALVALVTSAMLFEYVEYLCLAGVVFSAVTFVVLVWRRKAFQNPTLIIR